MSVSIVPNIAGQDAHSRPTAYTPTLSNVGGVSGSTFLWHQEGTYMVIQGQILFDDTGGSTALTFTLPSGFTIDTSLLPGGSNTANATASYVGAGGFWFDNGSGWAALFPKYVSTTAIGFWVNAQAFANELAADGDSLNFVARVPIVGW